MGRRTSSLAWRAALVLALALVAAACGKAAATSGDDPVVGVGIGTTSTTAKVVPTTAAPVTTAPTTTMAPTDGRTITDPQGAPFASVGGVILVHVSSAVEHVGFHESSNSGAQELEVLPTAVRPSTLNTRDRGTSPRTAADMVVQPDHPVLAPVTGTVVKAGPYRLYCELDDETVWIEPDSHPGWHVVVLHLQDVRVAVGGRVAAGLTVIAGHPHQLPFASQIDKLRTASPPWPHVHVEVDDPAIPDVPSDGDSC